MSIKIYLVGDVLIFRLVISCSIMGLVPRNYKAKIKSDTSDIMDDQHVKFFGLRGAFLFDSLSWGFFFLPAKPCGHKHARTTLNV